MNDLISRQATYLALVEKGQASKRYKIGETWELNGEEIREVLDALPSAQPEIIHCNSCKYWTQSTGKMKDYGLGRCDFHDADLVTCNGFCYWAERRNDG